MEMPAANSDSATIAWYPAESSVSGRRNAPAHETHARNGPFDRDRIGFDEQIAMQGHEALVDLRRAGTIAAQGGRHHVGHGARRDVRGDRNDADGADADGIARGEIVAAQHLEVRGATARPARGRARHRRPPP